MCVCVCVCVCVCAGALVAGAAPGAQSLSNQSGAGARQRPHLQGCRSQVSCRTHPLRTHTHTHYKRHSRTGIALDLFFFGFAHGLSFSEHAPPPPPAPPPPRTHTLTYKHARSHALCHSHPPRALLHAMHARARAHAQHPATRCLTHLTHQMSQLLACRHRVCASSSQHVTHERALSSSCGSATACPPYANGHTFANSQLPEQVSTFSALAAFLAAMAAFL